MLERRVVLANCLVALAFVCVGCGKTSPPAIVPVQGVVLLAGVPLPRAQVRFIPNIGLGAEYIAVGVTDAEGRFKLECNGKSGACAAEHLVLVGEPDIPAQYQGENRQRELAVYLQTLKNRPIPANYSSPVSTPLHVTVTDPQPELKLELAR